MGFWSLRRRASRKEAAKNAAPAPEPVEQPNHPAHPSPPPLPPDVERLLLFGDAKNPAAPSETEALALLRVIRKTAHEGMTVDALVQKAAGQRMPEALSLAVASALLDRGDKTSARTLLERASGTSALMLRADLLAEDQDFAGAVAMVERVLLRDLDLPGARERRLAWRKRLGLAPLERRADPATMTVATSHARTPFDLLREVARGGAGAVFAAKDRELGREVAVKLYHQPERDRAQLLHEGRVAAALEGPGIVRVFDIEPNEGWLALEWATLGALRDLLVRARDPEARGARDALLPLSAWAPKLARALSRVHAGGWVHHDVKPANVLMSRDPAEDRPVPWLADFGSARRAGEPSPPGSLGYVSPERIAGRASDPRDDVYGFGRVLEEVFAALAQGAGDDAGWRRIAAIAVGPSDLRPSDGGALVALLESHGLG